MNKDMPNEKKEQKISSQYINIDLKQTIFLCGPTVYLQ